MRVSEREGGESLERDKNITSVNTFDFEDVLASMRTRSPILNPSVTMVTSSTAGETARDEPLDSVDTVDTGDLVPTQKICLCCQRERERCPHFRGC